MNRVRSLKNSSHLTVDRDAKVVLLPPKIPNLDACMERWFRSLKSESLDRIIALSKRSIEQAVAEYVEHYHAEWNSQGPHNGLIEPGDEIGHAIDVVEYTATEIALALTPVCEGNRQVGKRKHGFYSQEPQSLRPQELITD